MEPKDLVLKPIVTEKSSRRADTGRYVFAVPCRATKAQIKDALGRLYQVKIKKIWSSVVAGKTHRLGRTRKTVRAGDSKKVTVQLAAGSKIESMEEKK